jgi:hypothetical protein
VLLSGAANFQDLYSNKNGKLKLFAPFSSHSASDFLFNTADKN